MSKEQKEKIPRDASWPEWYDGKTISEAGFCADFLDSHYTYEDVTFAAVADNVLYACIRQI